MPKRTPDLPVPHAPKKRGRKPKRKKVDGGRQKITPKPDLEVDYYASITAETATNLKAFRQLFASHEETDTEEEFTGYYPREIFAIQKACRRKIRKCKKEETSLLKPVLEDTLPVPQTTTTSSRPLISDKDIERSSLPSKTARKEESANSERFLGFPEDNNLSATCHSKSRMLFNWCERLVESVNSSTTLVVEPLLQTTPSLQQNLGRNHLDSDKNGVTQKPTSSRRGRKRKRKPVIKGSGSKQLPPQGAIWKSNRNADEFSQSIAGEITVTPILQSGVPLAVKRRCDSPIIINCLPKT